MRKRALGGTEERGEALRGLPLDPPHPLRNLLLPLTLDKGQRGCLYVG